MRVRVRLTSSLGVSLAESKGAGNVELQRFQLLLEEGDWQSPSYTVCICARDMEGRRARSSQAVARSYVANQPFQKAKCQCYMNCASCTVPVALAVLHFASYERNALIINS